MKEKAVSTFIHTAQDFSEFMLNEVKNDKKKSVIILVAEEVDDCGVKNVIGVGGDSKLLVNSLCILKREASDLFRMLSGIELMKLLEKISNQKK